MDQKTLFTRQESLNHSAHKILKELRLLERWQMVGNPYLVGSVAYGLMAAPDIDIEVFCPEEPAIKDGMEILQACAMHPGVYRVSFSNCMNTPDEGYYWQVRYRDAEQTEWKIDMWSVRKDYPWPTSRDMVDSMQKALTEESRTAILAIKEEMLTGKIARCISIYIYRAVLEGGVRSAAEFAAWRTQHPDEGLVSWRP